MDNHAHSSPAAGTRDEAETAAGRPPRLQLRSHAMQPRPRGLRRLPLLWLMVLVAVVAHVALIAATSTGGFTGGDSGDALEQQFQLGEEAMARGDYLGAMEHYQQVLDAQPKPPPIFTKAADRHRLADRLAKKKPALKTARPPTAGPSDMVEEEMTNDPAGSLGDGDPVRRRPPADDAPDVAQETAAEPTTGKAPAGDSEEPTVPDPEGFVPPELRSKSK